jgi:hypothetical protein
MAKGGNYFKGEKKKQRKNGDKQIDSSAFAQGSAPTYTMPDVIEKKKSSY